MNAMERGLGDSSTGWPLRVSGETNVEGLVKPHNNKSSSCFSR
jgi:hypothetical protein